MALPVVPVLLGGGLIAALYALTRKSVTPTDASLVANRGPNGEYVFKPEIAEGILRSLQGMGAAYPSGSADLASINVEPIANGSPPPSGKSAYDWAKGMNPTLSIMAPLSMGSTTGGERKLKAVAAGQENSSGSAWGVLLYSGCLAKGQPAPGSPSGGGQVKPIPAPSPLGGDSPKPGPVQPPHTLPSDSPEYKALMTAFDDLLANGQDPAAMEAAANEMEKYGFHDHAAKLRARAAELRARKPAPGPAPAPLPTPVAPLPAPPVIPAMFVYNPNLGSVGSGASYNPGPVDQDALALNFLGYNAGFPGSGPRGAWDATFQSGLKAFQTNNGLTVDGWIGPKSRAKLKEKVDEKQRGGAFPAPIPSAPVVPTLPTNVPFLYVPNLGSVGSGASYNPGPVDQDAAALNYLGYSAGSPPPQKAIGSGGAWDPTFRAAVTAFQKANGLTADSWIGPKTRTTIAKKVTEKNMGMGAQPVTSGIGVSGVDRRTGQKRIAKVASESGVRLRSQPKGDSEIYGVLPAGTSVQLVKMCPGNKVEGVSPGPGGWALVDVAGRRGWVVSEWLVLS